MMGNASRWLRTFASEGYCGSTQRRGDCHTGDKGSFGLPAAVADSWLSAVSWCLSQCEACERCNYIDVSVRHADCSWHASCDQQSLKTDVLQVRSGPALRTMEKEKTDVSIAALVGPIEAVSEQKYSPASCTSEEETGKQTVGISAWAGMGTGFNAVAGMSALHHAACCGGSAFLPALQSPSSFSETLRGRGFHGHMALGELLGNRSESCVSFRHLPVVAESSSLCTPTRKNAFNYYGEGRGHGCPKAKNDLKQAK